MKRGRRTRGGRRHYRQYIYTVGASLFRREGLNTSITEPVLLVPLRSLSEIVPASEGEGEHEEGSMKRGRRTRGCRRRYRQCIYTVVPSLPYPGNNSTISSWVHRSYFLFDHPTSLSLPESLLLTLLQDPIAEKLKPRLRPLPTQFVALLVEPDALARQQRLLQRPANLQTHQPRLQRHRYRPMIKDRGHKFLRLRCEGLFKSLPVLRLHFIPNPYACRYRHVVQPRHEVHHDFPRRVDHFGADVVAVGLGARAVEVGQLAAPVLDDADAVVDVVKGGEFWVVPYGAGGPDGFGDHIWAKEPEAEVDVVAGEWWTLLADCEEGHTDRHEMVHSKIGCGEAYMQQSTNMPPFSLA